MFWLVVAVLLAYHIVTAIFDIRMLYSLEHPEYAKSASAVFSKIITFCALRVMWLHLCSLPADVYNFSEEMTMDIQYVWDLAYLLLVMCFTLALPFGVYYSLAEDDPRHSKTEPWKKAIGYSILYLVIAGLVIGVCYLLFGSTSCKSPDDDYPFEDNCEGSGTINFFVFLACISSFFGHLFFVVFGGVGLAALPLDFIYAYIDRPKPMELNSCNDRKRALGESATFLKMKGEELKEVELRCRTAGGIKGYKLRYGYKKFFNQFKQSVYLLERDYQDLYLSLYERGENPAISYAKLVFGIIAAILSFVWTLNTLLYLLISQMAEDHIFGPWNVLMVQIGKSGLFIFDLLVYIIIIGYVLAASVYGVYKVSMRTFGGYGLAILKFNKTTPYALLFNAGAGLLMIGAISHFAQMSLDGYSYGSACYRIFTMEVNHVAVIGVLFKHLVFYWLFILVFVASLVWLLLYPRDTPGCAFMQPPLDALPDEKVVEETDMS